VTLIKLPHRSQSSQSRASAQTLIYQLTMADSIDTLSPRSNDILPSDCLPLTPIARPTSASGPHARSALAQPHEQLPPLPFTNYPLSNLNLEENKSSLSPEYINCSLYPSSIIRTLLYPNSLSTFSVALPHSFILVSDQLLMGADSAIIMASSTFYLAFSHHSSSFYP